MGTVLAMSSDQAAATTLSDDLALVRRFVESNGYAIVVMEDGDRSAFPMKTEPEPVLAALGRIEEALSRV